jgi:hypothetical protein
MAVKVRTRRLVAMAASAAMVALVTTALTVPAKTARMVALVVRAAMRVRAQQLA